MEIWIAIITGIFTLLGTIITIKQQTDLTIYRINQLEQKVNKHNQVIERIYQVEKHEAELDKDIEAIKERIEHLQ